MRLLEKNRKRPWRVVTALLLSFAFGCSGDEADAPAESMPQAKSFGIVQLQYVGGAATEGERDQSELTATAYFVRHRAVSADRLSALLALPLDPSTDLPAEDTCRVFDATAALSEDEIGADSGAYVDLLESGDVQLQTQRDRLTLVPGYFPGLIPRISGAVYGETQVDGAAAPTSVSVDSRGSEAVGGFSVRAGAPPVLDVVAQAAHAAATGIKLSWNPLSASETDAVSYIAVWPRHAGTDRVLRCRLRDDGAFSISRADLDALSATTQTKTLRIEAARMRIRPFRAEGLDHAELRISTASRLTVELGSGELD